MLYTEDMHARARAPSGFFGFLFHTKKTTGGVKRGRFGCAAGRSAWEAFGELTKTPAPPQKFAFGLYFKASRKPPRMLLGCLLGVNLESRAIGSVLPFRIGGGAFGR